MSFGLLTPARVRFGRGVAAEAASAVHAYGTRVLLVQGATASRADWLAEALAREGVEAMRLSVAGEPTVEVVERAAEMARGCDAVVALGGGSVIDAAKAAAALATAAEGPMAHLEVVGEGRPLEADPLPFVALPTTAGTGAEVTKNAVIGVPGAGRKVSLRDDRMLANLALVDPALTDGCPKAVTLASGLDAVTQVIEPYLSTKANPLTDAICRDAIPTGLRALRTLMEREDEAARDAMAFTSLCGGLALANAGLGAVHGLAGPVGGASGAPHGAVCGALLPHVLRANADRAGGELATRIAEVQAWIEAALGEDVGAFGARHGLPSLGDMGVGGDLPALAEASMASSSMKGNPVSLTEGDLVAILRAAGARG